MLELISTISVSPCKGLPGGAISIWLNDKNGALYVDIKVLSTLLGINENELVEYIKNDTSGVIVDYNKETKVCKTYIDEYSLYTILDKCYDEVLAERVSEIKLGIFCTLIPGYRVKMINEVKALKESVSDIDERLKDANNELNMIRYRDYNDKLDIYPDIRDMIDENHHFKLTNTKLATDYDKMLEICGLFALDAINEMRSRNGMEPIDLSDKKEFYRDFQTVKSQRSIMDLFPMEKILASIDKSTKE